MVLDGLVRADVTEAHVRPDGDLTRLDLLLRDDARVREPLLEHRDAGLQVALLGLRGVVLGVLRDVAELARDTDTLRHLAAPVVREVLISSLSFS